MNDEAVSNNFDSDAIVSELQVLNKGIVSNGEKLDTISEYLIAKQMQQEDEKASEKQAEMEKSAEEKRVADEQKAASDEQAETYTEILTEINEQVQLTNELFAVQTIYFGIVIGLLFMKIFIDRLTKR